MRLVERDGAELKILFTPPEGRLLAGYECGLRRRRDFDPTLAATHKIKMATLTRMLKCVKKLFPQQEVVNGDYITKILKLTDFFQPR